MDARDVLLLAFLLCVDPCRCSRQPRATVENGAVVGSYKTSHRGKIYESFEGIPYARPPVDDKRFREAEPLRGTWIGEWNATAPGSPCMQYDQYTRRRDENGDWVFSVVGDEDCLFVNVYAREGSSDKDVVVFIHGGAFMFGSGDVYGPDYLIDLKDVVMVTFNYRLGPLGFLTTGDGFCPGNNGLKDQSLALEWVQRNIAAFGGDPRKVTIVGLSAGGASVHYHYLSELSHGLFSRGYSFSGSALGPWTFQRDGVEKTKTLAGYLGCPTSDSRSLVKCLRRRPARKIVEQVKNFQSWVYNPFAVFGPVKEAASSRAFIEEEPRELLRQGRVQDLPWITSFTSEDGLYPAGDYVDDDRFLAQLDENWDALAPHILFYGKDRARGGVPASRIVREHYLGREPVSRDTTKALIRMLSDRLFIAPAVEAATLQARANAQSVYLYSYEFQGSRSTSHIMSESNATFGVSHGDDTAFIVKFYSRDTHISDADKEMANALLDILDHYVKKGSPPPSLKWKPVSRKANAKLNYLRIRGASDVKMGEEDDVGNGAFLRELLDGASPPKDEL